MTSSPSYTAWIRRALRAGVTDLVTVRPAIGTHRAAIRAGSTVLGALLVLLVAGRLDWAAYACFGTLATAYGGPVADGRRLRMQASLGLVLTGCVLTGAIAGTSSSRRWIAVPVVAAIAGLAAAGSDRFRWRPAGPLFPVLTAGTCSSIPTAPSDVFWAALVAAATATVGVVLGGLEGLLPIAPLPAPPPLFPGDPTRRRHRVQWMRCTVAVLIAGVLATVAHIGHPYWAMVAAVVPLTVMRLRMQVARGLHRAAGTVVGLGVASLLLLLPLPPWAEVLLIAALQAASETLVTRNYASALTLITPLALLSAHLAVPLPVAGLLSDRFVETVLGTAVGLAAAVATRDRARKPV